MNWADSFGEALRGWSQKVLNRSINTLSLFTGAGGLDIAFHDAGFAIKQVVEIDKRFVDTLHANNGPSGYFGGTSIHCCDIRDFHPEENMGIDFIIGGPPCQTFSAAGRRAAGVQGTQDQRGTLFEEYVRLLKRLEPQGFLFENVYGITGAEQGEAWKKIQLAFKQAGYNIHFRILDAADFGVPQHRERLFIVGTRDAEYRFPRPTHGLDSPDKRPYQNAARAIIGAAAPEKDAKTGVSGRFGHLLEQIPPGLNYSFFTEQMGHPNPIFAWRSKFSDFLYKADPETPIRTLKAQGGQYTGPFHWENRPFSLGELKRLQTFPDKYNIIGCRQVAVHQIGNSVPPQIGRILALTILNQIFDINLPSDIPTLEPREKLSFRKRKRDLTAKYQAKAQEALRNSRHVECCWLASYSSRDYMADLSDNFGWLETGDSAGTLRISSIFDKDQWTIHVSDGANHNQEAFCIHLSSTSSIIWALRKTNVNLIGNRLDGKVFTSVWKALEAELARLNVKADLVQLCGYYQYPPTFSCTLKLLIEPVSWEWHGLKEVVGGKGVGKIISESKLAEFYGIDLDQVLDFGLWLRSLGYEVRNHNTNPQIPKGSYLIPYAFPTLVPMSVQLKKSLLGVSNDRRR